MVRVLFGKETKELTNKKNTETKIQANNRYNAKSSKIVPLRLNLNTDSDILDKLDQVPSKMGYIKELIRKDMQK